MVSSIRLADNSAQHLRNLYNADYMQYLYGLGFSVTVANPKETAVHLTVDLIDTHKLKQS